MKPKKAIFRRVHEFQDTLNVSIILILTTTFLPAVFSSYGRLDDFGFYLFTRTDVEGVVNSGYSYGRPITSYILGETFSMVNSISGFAYLRFFSLVVLCATVLIFRQIYLNGTRLDSNRAIMVLVGFVSLPGIWVFITWAQGLPHFIGLFFVALATSSYLQTKTKLFYYLFSILAMYTYQPFGLLIPTLVLVKVYLRKNEDYSRDFLRLFFWTTILLTSNFLMVKAQPNPNVRSELVSDIFGKWEWLAGEWFPRVLFPWDIEYKLLFSWLVFVIFFVVSTCYVIKFSLKKYSYIFLFMVFPSIPFIFSSENWATSRAILASNISFVSVMTLMLIQLDFKLRFKCQIRKLFELFATILYFLAIYQGYQGLVFPQVAEWTTVQTQIATLDNNVNKVSAELSFFEQTSSPVGSYDEFGILNSSVETALRGMITLALTQAGKFPSDISISTDRKCQDKLSIMDITDGVFYLRPLAGVKGCTS